MVNMIILQLYRNFAKLWLHICYSSSSAKNKEANIDYIWGDWETVHVILAKLLLL